MSKKITNLSKYRRQKRPRTLEGAAKAAVRRYYDPKLEGIEEPQGLASGRTSRSGSFISDKDNPEEEDS